MLLPELNPFTRVGPLVTNAVQKYGSRIPADLSSCCSHIVMLVKEWTSGGAGEVTELEEEFRCYIPFLE